MFFILYLFFLSINSSIQLSEITARNAAGNDTIMKHNRFNIFLNTNLFFKWIVCAYLSDKIVCYGGSPDDSRYDILCLFFGYKESNDNAGF